MYALRVKICGVTNLADALAAVEAGADALGFVFAPSPRRIEPGRAREIIGRLPPFVSTVGVFSGEEPDRVRDILSVCGLDYAQFHGDEPPDVCNAFGRRAIRAVRVKGPSSLADLGRFRVGAFLLDSFVEGVEGGTGEVFPWEIAAAAGTLGAPIILAGGLTPENVAEAVRRVKPFAVDVSSGVEEAPGRKDRALVEEFIRRAKGAG